MTISRLMGAFASLVVLSAVSCEGESETEATGEVTASITVDLPEFAIPVGESFQCFYSDVITDKELSVVNAAGVQVEGGHHLSLYFCLLYTSDAADE